MDRTLVICKPDAVERAAWLVRRYGAEIEWYPFDLHPEYPPEGIPRERIEAKYGAAWMDRLAQMFAADGLPVSTGLTKVPNSRKALRLAELARERGRHADLHPRLFDALWVRGLDLGDDDVLIAEAEAAGLDEGEAREVLASDRYADVVQRETETALESGAGGVPAWVVDERLLIPGAQPEEIFERVLAKIGY